MITVIIGERRSHTFEMALVHRDYIDAKSERMPDYWTRVGWINTLKKMNVECDVCFFGNSLTAASDFQKNFPNLSIVNLGLPGDDLVDMFFRIPMIQAVNPKVVFVMAGTNDLFLVSEKLYLERYAKLLNSMKDSLPQARIVIESILPMNHTLKEDAPSHDVLLSANNSIRKLANENGCDFINLYDLYVEDGDMPRHLTKDGIHLYPKAYERWAEAITPYIQRYIK